MASSTMTEIMEYDIGSARSPSPSVASTGSFDNGNGDTAQTSVAGSILDQYPEKTCGPMVWRGETMNAKDYVVYLSDQDLTDIRAAVIHFKRKCTLHGYTRSGSETDNLIRVVP